MTDHIPEDPRGDVSESELTSTGGKIFKVGYFEKPVVDRLDPGEEVHHVLRNFVDGLEKEGETYEPSDNRRAVACLTDRRILIVVGGERGDKDATFSVAYDDVVRVERDDRTLVVTSVESKGAEVAVTWRFPVKNDDQLDDAVAFLEERAAGSAGFDAIEAIDERAAEAREALEGGEYDAALDAIEAAFDAYERYDDLASEVDTDAQPELTKAELRNLRAEVRDAKREREYDSYVETAEQLAAEAAQRVEDGEVDEGLSVYDEAIEASERAIDVATEHGVGDLGAAQDRRDDLEATREAAEREVTKMRYDSLVDEAVDAVEAATEHVDDGAFDAALSTYDEAIDAFERAIEVAREGDVGDPYELEDRLDDVRTAREQAVTEKHRQRYESHLADGDEAADLADERADDDTEAALAAYGEAVDAYERALDVAEDRGVGDPATVEERIAAVETRREDLQISTLGRRTADVTVPDADDAGEFADAVETLEGLLDRIESLEVDRTADLDLIREEAATKLVRARLGLAEHRAREAADAFRAEDYREAQGAFADVESDLEALAATAEEMEVDDFDDRIERLRERCESNANAARRASIGLADDVSLDPIEDESPEGPTDRGAGDVAAGGPRGPAGGGPDSAPAAGSAAGATGAGGPVAGGGSSAPTTRLDGLTYEDVEKEDRIGSGGNADVYRATATVDGEEYALALKEPRMQGTLHAEVTEKFVSEAETWSNLDDHDHVVSVLGYGASPLPWIALEYMDRGHLGENAAGMDLARKFEVAIAITDAVWHAHQRGVAHLDLKPENILLTDGDGGGEPVPKVADWGLARMLLNNSNSVEGLSPQYSAPEQFDSDTYGTPDNRTDVYQLGIILYELFAGEHPFQGPPTEVMQSVLYESPDPPSAVAPELPDAVDDIVLRALEKEPDDRYEATVYLRDALQRAAP